MKVAIYPGSFDPVTFGHLDVIRRSLNLFDKVHVVVMQNNAKTPMFSADERKRLIEESIFESEIGTGAELVVESSTGLLVDFAKRVGATAIIKGLRAVSDFEMEFQMAAANQVLEPGLESVFVMTRAEYMYLSSSIVREVAYFGGDISSFVTPCVMRAIADYHRRKNGR